MRRWRYLRLFVTVRAFTATGALWNAATCSENLGKNSLSFIGLLLAIQFTYLMMMLPSQTILKWCSLRWARQIYWRLPLEIPLLYCLHCILCNHHTHHLRLYLLHLRMLYLRLLSCPTTWEIRILQLGLRKEEEHMSLRRVKSMTPRGLWRRRLGGRPGEGELVNHPLPILLMSLLPLRPWTLPLHLRSSSLYSLSLIDWLYFNFSAWLRCHQC